MPLILIEILVSNAGITKYTNKNSIYKMSRKLLLQLRPETI